LDSIGVIPPQVAERVTISPPPSWVVERALEQDATKPAASNHYLLIDHQHHVERHAGYRRTVRKLDTINAVQESGQFRIDFDPRSDRLTIHSLAVIRGEQRGENAKMPRLRILQREAGLESLVIHGLLTVVALLEDVRVGDILDLSYTIHSQSPVFPDHFWRWHSIPEQLPVRVFSLSARFATGRAMRWKSNDTSLTPAIREENGETEWSWKTTLTPNLDVESNVPEWHRLGKWIQLSDFASWGDIAAGFAAAWNEDLENPEIVRLAQSIVAAAATPAQRAERALTFFQDDIRYLSVSGDLGGTVPSAPGQVLKRGFGDCKDKSFAAAHLLRRLGIPARPMLVHSTFRQYVREFLPMPAAFNHAIVEYDIDGRRRWVDVTAALQGGSALSRPGTPFHLGLPIGPGVQDLETMTAEASSDRLELRETFLIDTTGRTSSLRVVVRATGQEADRWRRSIAEEGVEVFARWREQFYQGIFPNAKRAGQLECEDDRENNEFVLGEVFDLHEFGSSYDRRSVRFRLAAHTIQSILSFRHIGKRRNPWVLPYPCRIKHVIEIDSPSLHKPIGKSARVDGDAFRFSSNWQGHEGFTTITFTLQVLKDAVPAAKFEDFKKDVLEVWKHTAVVGNLPPGSSVPWKKRAPKNVLPPRRNPAPAPPHESYAPPEDLTSLPTIAPPCSSSGVASTVEKGGQSAVVPRREKPVPLHDPLVARERNDIRRPNPSLPSQEELVAASTDRRKGRRRARRARRRLIWGLAIIAGLLLLLGMLIFLFHQK